MQIVAPNSVVRSLTRTSDFFAKLERDTVDFVKNVSLGIGDGAELFRRYQALSRMSNAELAKRGLTRADVIAGVLSDDSCQPK